MDAWQRVWPFAFGPRRARCGPCAHPVLAGAPRIGGATDAQGAPRPATRRCSTPSDSLARALQSRICRRSNALLFEVPRDEYTCGLAHTIALFQSEVAAAIHDEWTREGGFRHAALSAGGDSDVYEEDSEVAGDVMRALAESLSVVASRKLAAPLGKSAEAAKPKRAESWRSGRSLRNVGLNLETLRAVVETPGGFADLLAVHGEAALADNLRDELAAAATMASVVTPPLRDAVADPDEREKLLDLLAGLRVVRALVTGPLSRATGILIGFNSQDGD